MHEARRAQVAMEMFIAFSIALLFLFWFSNYINMFSSSTGKIGVNQQQKLANKDLARLANEVCASGANLSVKTPCIMEASDSVLYQIYDSGPNTQNINMFNAFTDYNSSEKADCYIGVNIPESVQCTSFDRLCLHKRINDVVIERGACG